MDYCVAQAFASVTHFHPKASDPGLYVRLKGARDPNWARSDREKQASTRLDLCDKDVNVSFQASQQYGGSSNAPQ